MGTVALSRAQVVKIVQAGGSVWLQPSTAYISADAPQYLLRVTAPGQDGGTIAFTGYNATKTITPPSAAESIDGAKLGV